MNIPDLIKEYLRNHDVLTVPRLGTFTLQYKPSKINEFSKTISPPSREILFSSELKDDDGTFDAFVAKNEEITLDEAKEQITFYINRVHDLLEKGKFVQISDVGMISKSGDKLEFSTLLRENLHKPSFGLTDIKFETPSKNLVIEKTPVAEIKVEKEKPVVKEKVTKIKEKEKPVAKVKIIKEKKTEPKTRSNKTVYWLVAGALTSIIAVLVFIFIFSDIPQNLGIPSFKTLVAKFTPTAKEIKTETPKPIVADTVKKIPAKDTTTIQQPVSKNIKTDTTAVKVAKVIDMQNCKEKALNPANDTKKKVAPASGTRYYLIAGSFKNLINAQKLLKDLKKQGYPSELVSDKLIFRISYKSFGNKEEANQEMQAMQKKGIAGLWILNFETK